MEYLVEHVDYQDESLWNMSIKPTSNMNRGEVYLQAKILRMQSA